MPKPTIDTSKTHIRPHFASHTQSSLMKRRTPMKLKKSSSIKDANEPRKSQGGITLKLNRVHKRRSNVTKRSRSMQMLITILKQQRDRRTTVLLPGELTGTTSTSCELENSLVTFCQSDLIKDVSHDLKICTGSPAKSATLHELTKIINEFASCAEDLHASPQDGTDCAGRDNSENTHDTSKNYTIVDVEYIQLDSSVEEVPADPRCEVEDLRRGKKSEEKPDNFPNNDFSEVEMQTQNVNITTNRKRTRKTWRKAEHVDIDRACRTVLQVSKSTRVTKHVDNPQDNLSANGKPVANSGATTQKTGALQKNLASNQRAWRPPGAPRTWITESATSLQPISQKSQSTKNKSTVWTKSKHSSTERIESNSESSTSSQSKISMKENRDPHANRMTKISAHLTEAKQRQRLQSGGTLPRKKWSRTKTGSKVLDKRDDTNPTLSKSKSRHCQTPSIMPKESSNNSNNIEQHRTIQIYKRSRTSEVIHTLKKIINNVTEDEDAKENVVKNADDHEKKNSEIQTSSSSDTSQDNELQIFTKDEATRSSHRSISTQTKLESSLYHEIDAEKDQDLQEILKLTRIVATQTSSSRNRRNVVGIGCDTTDVICNDVEVSCNLIGSINLKAEVEPTTIENKSMSDVPIRSNTEPSFIKRIENDTNENEELLFGGYKKTEMSLKLENCDSAETSAKTTIDAAGEAEMIMYEKACQISLKPSKNSDDKTNIDIDKNQESTNGFNNHDVNSTSANNLFLERSRPSIYDTSSSSEEVLYYLENDVEYEDMVPSELKAEDVPSGIIAAFELAAERARNIHEAITLYHKNLMLKESEKQARETVEDCETSEFRDEQNRPEKYASFIQVSRENKDKMKSECKATCHSANNGENFDGFATCSSRGSSIDQIYEFPRLLKDDHFKIDHFEIDILRKKEGIVLSENEQAIARSLLNERSNLPISEDVKSLIELLHCTQEEYALVPLQSERNDDSFEMEQMINDKALVLPAAIKRTSFISHLRPLIYCIICTVMFWYLQFSFRCDPTK